MLQTVGKIIYTLLEKFLAEFAVHCTVYDRCRYCQALCDVKVRQAEGNGRKFPHTSAKQ